MTDMCNTGTCDPTTGACTAVPVADGTSCDDADMCTSGDVCSAGVCGGASTNSGDTCAGALTVPAGDGLHVLTGTTNACYADDGQGSCHASGGRDIIYQLDLTAPRRVRFETTDPGTGGGFDTSLHVRTTCGDGATEVACNDDGGTDTLSRIDTDLQQGTYFVYMDAYSGSHSGDYRLEVDVREPNGCADAAPLAIPAVGGTTTITGSTSGAANTFTSTCGGSANSADHVYELSVATTTRLRFETIASGTGYDALLHVRGSPCAEGAGTTLYCDDDGGSGLNARIEQTFPPGTYYLIVDGYSTGSAGNYQVEVANLTEGHAVLIGHDYFVRQADADRVLGNAVFLTAETGTVEVLEYRQFADTTASGEVANMRAAIDARATALGRTVNYTALDDYTALDLTGYDVLLVPEQETSSQAMMQTVATAWNADLDAFLDRGGVIVVADYMGSSGGTWEIVDGPGLMTISGSSNVTGSTLTLTGAADAVGAGVSATYTAPNGSLSFPGATGGTAVISAGTDPVVLHLQR